MGRDRYEACPGDTFGSWTVLGEGEPYFSPRGKKYRRLRVECGCGKVADKDLQNLLRGQSTQCTSCALRSRRPPVARRVGAEAFDVLANRFYAIRSRCQNPKTRTYPHYGGRGVECRFASAEEFVEYIAEELGVDLNREIDRIDNDGHYEPGNLRYATRSEQNSNRRDSHRIEYRGRTYSATEFWRRFAPAYADSSTVIRKARAGYTPEGIIRDQANCRGPYSVRHRKRWIEEALLDLVGPRPADRS